MLMKHSAWSNNWLREMTERHAATVRVLYGDVDSMKQAYYGNYLRWFEVGRAEFLRSRKLSYRDLESSGFFLPVSEAYCKYLKPVRYDDLLTIEAVPENVRRVSARFAYRIMNQAGQLVAEGYTVHPCMDGAGKMVRMPPFLVEVLSSDESEVRR